MLKPGALRLPLLLSVLLPALAGAGELYRYVNDKGVIVLDRQGVPPEYIGKGYDVLSDQGRVVRVVPPAPTAEERQRLQAQQAQATSDAQLLRLYSSLDDVDRARERKLTELDGAVGAARGNLQSLRTQQANLQGQAAEQERAGRVVPESLLVQISNIKGEQESLLKDIERFEETRKQASAGFVADRARLAQLLGLTP
ncbi:DUF4124 domain-containing protein [Pseudomonas sp.]|jgi:hypothetical protein|uniref:DUF4124 domain-containing protein n=1 Tax=Pseudomonas sp. TaxID=306 RepID=UPI002C4B450A|nr:DUF4124 domain-containing protein [Pseudomonas sp.]HRL94569.1 DUF4124 domain-containing protein [Pseudomonas sp.]